MRLMWSTLCFAAVANATVTKPSTTIEDTVAVSTLEDTFERRLLSAAGCSTPGVKIREHVTYIYSISYLYMMKEAALHLNLVLQERMAKNDKKYVTELETAKALLDKIGQTLDSRNQALFESRQYAQTLDTDLDGVLAQLEVCREGKSMIDDPTVAVEFLKGCKELLMPLIKDVRSLDVAVVTFPALPVQEIQASWESMAKLLALDQGMNANCERLWREAQQRRSEALKLLSDAEADFAKATALVKAAEDAIQFETENFQESIAVLAHQLDEMRQNAQQHRQLENESFQNHVKVFQDQLRHHKETMDSKKNIQIEEQNFRNLIAVSEDHLAGKKLDWEAAIEAQTRVFAQSTAVLEHELAVARRMVGKRGIWTQSGTPCNKKTNRIAELWAENRFDVLAKEFGEKPDITECNGGFRFKKDPNLTQPQKDALEQFSKVEAALNTKNDEHRRQIQGMKDTAQKELNSLSAEIKEKKDGHQQTIKAMEEAALEQVKKSDAELSDVRAAHSKMLEALDKETFDSFNNIDADMRKRKEEHARTIQRLETDRAQQRAELATAQKRREEHRPEFEKLKQAAQDDGTCWIQWARDHPVMYSNILAMENMRVMLGTTSKHLISPETGHEKVLTAKNSLELWVNANLFDMAIKHVKEMQDILTSPDDSVIGFIRHLPQLAMRQALMPSITWSEVEDKNALLQQVHRAGDMKFASPALLEPNITWLMGAQAPEECELSQIQVQRS